MSSAVPPNGYKVEVLYLLNPHLIWVEVRDPAIVFDEHEIKFEQVGIYGLLPLETTISVDDDEISVHSCEEWAPAAATRMREFLEDEEEVWFTPSHVDQRSSIFDDNVHKFGDLHVKKRNGKTRSMIKVLKNTGFATYDACMFHQYLSLGKINTKLSNIETQNVLTELEKYFIRKNVPKKKWEEPFKSQTSIFRVGYDLEEALTTTNLDKHNKNMKVILENKKRDLELCKGVDEPSLGRGSVRKNKEKKKQNAVEKKLELMKNRKPRHGSVGSEMKENRNNEHLQAFEDTKNFLEANAAPYSKKIYSKTDAQKAQILKKVMSKTSKKVSKQEKLVNRLLNESRKEANEITDEDRNVDVEKNPKQTDDSFSSSGLASTSISSQSSEPVDNYLNVNDIGIEETNLISDIKHLLETQEIIETSKPLHNILDKNDNHIVSNSENSEIKENETIVKPDQEPSVTIEESAVSTSTEEQPELNKPSSGNRANYHYHHHRRSSRGKPNRRGAKAFKSESQAPPNLKKPKPRSRSISPLQKLAYPPNIANRDVEARNFRRVPDLPIDFEAFATKPVSEQMVKKLMSTFKLTGSKHSEMIQNAIRKCKEGGRNNAEAITALLECRNKIIDEIKELDEPQNLTDINLELPLTQTLSQTKLKKKGKKNNASNGKNKIAFGPPGIDLNTLNRVPPVVLYGEEKFTNVDQTAEITLNDGDSSVSLEKDPAPGCSYINKLVTETVVVQEKEIRNKKNENRQEKDTSSSSSSMWEKRLKLHKEMAKNKRCASHTSDTTNKDSSNTEDISVPKSFTKQNVDEDSDDSISDFVEKLGIGYNINICNGDKNAKGFDNFYFERGIKANPFQNYDNTLSVFVDKLVTPIMMVHSKMNKLFVPTTNIRDIHFTDHIRSVLKTLNIRQPMTMQTISWNAILRGYSVFMIGSTSSGKTMGYLPAVCRLVSDFHHSDLNCDSVGPFCIIVCATARSVSHIERAAKMLVGCDEKIVSCHYDLDEMAIATSLLNGCDLLIATAPSLVRLLQMTDYAVDLQRLTTFVLDDCERLSEVYSDELKFCLYKVKEMIKLRVNKELPVQYIVASRVWCDFMESFAKKAPDSVICIGAFQECVLYAKSNMKVSYVKKENKLNHLIDFLETVDPSKRTVVVCDTDEEVDYLNRAIHSSKYFIFASNGTMTVEDLYNLSMLWKEFREPMMAPVLICRDVNLYHTNIVDANYLVQYSMPPLYSTFCRRFATLNENYPSIFKTENPNIKILILLEEQNLEQIPKILNFVKRCTNDVPDFLEGVSKTVLAARDIKKAENFAPLCPNLLSFGDCPDLHNCNSRHAILKDYDTPKEWMPKSGIVTFKILHYQSATFYSARLIGNFDAGTNVKYPSTYSHMSLTMGMHYAKQANRIAFGFPKAGDVCAVALRNNLFCRAQVLKVVEAFGNGKSKNVVVNLLDEEKIEVTSDIDLYHLPDDFKKEITYVVQVRLVNIQPRDKDVDFSDIATDQLKETISAKKNVYMKGKVVLTFGNCIFVDTLEACQDLKSLKETVVICNVKRELLEKHAVNNTDHLAKINELCIKAELILKPPTNDIVVPVKAKPEIRWAYLEEDMTMVDFGYLESPDTLFLRQSKFEDCMKILITDIQKHVANSTSKIDGFEKDDIVLAEYPDDGMYERARIDEIVDKKIKCFFVDQGEWHYLTDNKLKPISDALITQLPFQAIECRLVGIRPPGDQWAEFSNNWLFDRCSKTEGGVTKQLYVQHFTKEIAQFTGGHKYGIVVIDTYGKEDLILNQLMIDLNLAAVVEDEMKFLDVGKYKNECEAISIEAEDDDDSWEDMSKYSTNSDSTQTELPSVILSKPKLIQSVPLVGTDDESDCSDKWNINMTEEMAEMLKPFVEGSTEDAKTNLPAIECGKDKTIEKNGIDSIAENIKKCSMQCKDEEIEHDACKELDSDDLSSPETCQSGTETLATNAVVPLNEYQIRKPKLIWRQTKMNITIKIQLIGAVNYDLKIQDRALNFTATVNDTHFGFELELYGVIDKETATHSNKGQYILVKLNKVMHKNWLTLTKDGGIKKWIVYDVDSIDTSSDEEEVHNDNLYNFVKDVHNKTDSESDEDINYGTKYDDVNFKYKK